MTEAWVDIGVIDILMTQNQCTVFMRNCEAHHGLVRCVPTWDMVIHNDGRNILGCFECQKLTWTPVIVKRRIRGVNGYEN